MDLFYLKNKMHCHGCYENNPIVVAVPALLWGEEIDKVELIHVATKLTNYQFPSPK
jgi:hypothetical protein